MRQMAASRGRLCPGSATARTAPRPRFVVTCSAAARRGPLDLRTRRVPNPQGHQPMRRHCCARCAQQAEPPPSRNRSVWRYGVRRYAWHVATSYRGVAVRGAVGSRACGRSVWSPGVRVGCRDVIARSRRVAIRRAPIRAACGTVVARVAVWGAVGGRACGRSVWLPGVRMACRDVRGSRGVWRYGVRRYVRHVAPLWRG